MKAMTPHRDSGSDAQKGRSFFPQKEQRHGLFFQPKLAIGPTDDVYEREADAVADQIMRMDDGKTVQPKISPVAIQPKCAACEEEERLQRKESEAGEGAVTKGFEHYVGNLGSGGEPLPGDVRNFYEPKFGYDFSKVKIHSDTVAAKSAQSINALAYTSGHHIVFNHNQYSTGSISGKKLLAHELTHVVQQGGGHAGTHESISKKADPDESSQTNPEATSIKSIGSETPSTIQRQVPIPFEAPPFGRPLPMPFEGVKPIPVPEIGPLPPVIPIPPEVEIGDPELDIEPEMEEEPEVEPDPAPDPGPDPGPSPKPQTDPRPYPPLPPVSPDPEDEDKNVCGSTRMPLTHVSFSPGPTGQAGTVIAEPLTRCPGNTRGSLANWRVYPEQFKCIKKLGLGRFWLPVHMLHGMTPRHRSILRNLHGPGNDRLNIIIAHSSVNRQMNAQVEEPALMRVYDLNQVLWYESKVDSYVPGAEFFTQSITVNYGLMDVRTGSRGPRIDGGTFTSSEPVPNCPRSLGGSVMAPPLLPKELADFNSTISVCERLLKSRVFPVDNGGLKITLRASRPPGCTTDDYFVSLEKNNPVFDDEISTTKVPAGKPVTLTWKHLEKGEYYLNIWVPASAGPDCCLTGAISVFTFDAPRPPPMPPGRQTA